MFLLILKRNITVDLTLISITIKEENFKKIKKLKRLKLNKMYILYILIKKIKKILIYMNINEKSIKREILNFRPCIKMFFFFFLLHKIL